MKKILLLIPFCLAINWSANARQDECWVTNVTVGDGFSQETQWNSCTGDWFILTTWDDGSTDYWDSYGLFAHNP